MTFPRIKNHTVTTSPTQILRRNRKRRAVLIVNTDGSEFAYLVSSERGTTSQGIPIGPNYNHYRNKGNCQGAYWIVCGSGTVDVRVEEDIEG